MRSVSDDGTLLETNDLGGLVPNPRLLFHQHRGSRCRLHGECVDRHRGMSTEELQSCSQFLDAVRTRGTVLKENSEIRLEQ